MRFRCRGFGLEIASDLAIPGAVDSADSTAALELTIRLGHSRLGAEANEFPPYRQLGTKLELVVPGVARYLLDSPDKLTVTPDEAVSDEDVSALLIASGIPMALWARGGLLLHASGVVLAGSGKAIAIVGASGSGKSTLARALVENGGKLAGDDSLWLRERSGEFTASGLPGGIFGPNAGQADRPFWPVSMQAQAGTAELAAIVILDPTIAANGPLRLRGAAALSALLRHRHRPRVPALLGVEAERFAFTALLCAQVPVYALGGAPEANADRINHICGLPLAGP